jgi:hypothetical protein
MSTRKVVLLFVGHGPVPTEVKEMVADVGSRGIVVRYRNAHFIEKHHGMEECDAVMCMDGVELPPQYKGKPHAQDLIEQAISEKEMLKKLTGDEPPKKSESESEPPPNAKEKPAPTGASWGKNK